MKRMLTVFFSLALIWPFVSEAKETKSKQVAPPEELSDYAAVTIMARHCAGCHQEADHPGAMLLNEKKLSQPETIRLIRKLIDTEQMPPVHQKFKKSRDGKSLLRWLVAKEKELPVK